MNTVDALSITQGEILEKAICNDSAILEVYYKTQGNPYAHGEYYIFPSITCAIDFLTVMGDAIANYTIFEVRGLSNAVHFIIDRHTILRAGDE